MVEISGGAPANTSSVRFSLVVRDDATGRLLFEDGTSSPDGYVRSGSAVLNVEGGQLLRVEIDNAATGSIGGSEFKADVLATLELSFVIPEPVSPGGLLLAGGCLLGRRRRAAR